MQLYNALSEQVDKLKGLLSESNHRFDHFRNLVFKGGGMKGAAYIGVLEVLDREGILPQIERVAGTSSGAITAVLLSMRREFPETMEMIEALDISKVPQRKEKTAATGLPLLKKMELHALEEISMEVESANRFLKRYGWYSSEYVYNWMQNIISRTLDLGPGATFVDFDHAGCRDLYIVTYNLSRKRSEVFSIETTPDTPVADAVRLSMSIPLFFEALQYDGKAFGSGDFYVDGGILHNYPIHIFDEVRFAERSRLFRNGINYETLGCYLYPGEFSREEPELIGGFMGYLNAVLTSLYGAHQVAAYELNPFNQLRTIKIPDCGVDPTDFSLTRDDDRYQCLVQSGYSAAVDYLKEYNYRSILAA